MKVEGASEAKNHGVDSVAGRSSACVKLLPRRFHPQRGEEAGGGKIHADWQRVSSNPIPTASAHTAIAENAGRLRINRTA
jgi:hypothetical protein